MGVSRVSGEQGRGIALTNTSISRVGLLEKATLEQRLKGVKWLALDVKGKRAPERGPETG